MKILLTGTHFTPAQALIEVLKTKKVDLVYIGRKNTLEGDSAVSVESKVLPDKGVKFLPIIAGRLQRQFSIYTLTSLLKIPIGFIQAFIYLIIEKPNIVVSFGGYVGLPVVFSAWLLSIPILVHEQTLVSGLSNKLSVVFADKVAVSFKDHELLNNPKAFFSGNPLRVEILEGGKPSKEFLEFFENAKREEKKVLLVTGGNQGSHIINETLFELIPNLTKEYAIIQQTGDSKLKDFEKLETLREVLEKKSSYMIKKWIDVKDWSYGLRNVDLIIARAGVNTLFEITYLSKKGIIIPIPFIYKEEQIRNAEYFSKFGFTKVIPQKDLTPKKLLNLIHAQLKTNIKPKASDLGVKSAAANLALEAMLLGRKNAV